ncbi:MAG: YqgE/AlgH family protein [Planctomycetaceae bacterium]
MSTSLKGHFLVAAKHMRDSNFYRTVVLMVEHGLTGAMGLVVNRPSSISVSQALAGHIELPETGDLVYIGGPVEPGALFILHNQQDLDNQQAAVLPNLFVGGSPATFEHIVRSLQNSDDHIRYRIFAGCAGWGANQLEGEIDRGDWYSLPANEEFLFHPDPYSIWDLALTQISLPHRLHPELPQNPEWN